MHFGALSYLQVPPETYKKNQAAWTCASKAFCERDRLPEKDDPHGGQGAEDTACDSLKNLAIGLKAVRLLPN